jgi:hemoglobin/transferrin/lactoferrin receptor protein
MRWILGTSAAAAALLSFGSARGEEAQDGTVITVTATRVAAEPFDVPSVVTVIDEEEIAETLASDIKDLVRFEPGVSVPTAPSRFGAALASTGRDGNSGFSIRGLGGNRVLITVDGVRVPDGFSFGPASFGRGDYVDLDLLQSVEIVRGPASALYGSDGLAGVVSFITRDPRGFLDDGETFAARVRAGYASADESVSGAVVAAGAWNDWSALVSYTRREGHETANQGESEAPDSTRTAPNPQDIESNAALARLVFQPSGAHRLRLTADWGDRQVVTEALSGRAPLATSSTSVIDLDGLDESVRSRVTLDYSYDTPGGLLDRVFAAAYYQESTLLQFSDEDRNTAADRTRRSTFDNSVWGLALQGESSFTTGGVSHRLVFGGDYSNTRQEGLRDGTAPPTGESFPTRAFPNTDYTLTGVFVQDEIGFMDGRVVFFPAVRFDSYELSPEADALYPLATAGQSDERVTPRFGVVAWPTERVGVFFNYAQGFKAPSPSQVNNNFANPLFGYTSIPNPDLRPETSEALELGVRLRDLQFAGGALRASGAAFMADYGDFIEQVLVSGSFTPSDPAVFQFVNLSGVQISGLEGRADLSWENGFGLRVSASWAEGEQVEGGVRAPLESIDPFKFVAGLSFDAPGGSWGGQLIATFAAQKDEADTAAGNFRPDAFSIVDLTAYWRVTDAAVFRVGIFNLTDETYWWWSDVRGLSAGSSVIDAYSQPGRNISASLSYRF